MLVWYWQRSDLLRYQGSGPGNTAIYLECRKQQTAGSKVENNLVLSAARGLWKVLGVVGHMKVTKPN